MKYCTSLCITLLASFCIKAQTSFEIVFDDSKSAAKIDKVEMFDESQKEYYIRPFKKSVKFLFKKKTIDSYWIVYLSGEKRIRQPLPMWLDNGDVKIIAHADSFKLIIDTVINSPFYYKSNRVFTEVKNLLKKKDTLSTNDLLISAYKENTQNPFSVAIADRYLYINQLNRQRLRYLKELMDANGDKLKWYLKYKPVNDKLNMLLAESFIHLNDFNFTDIRGKVSKANFETAENIVLDFWFLRCPGCIADHKIIHRNISLLKSKKVELIGISTDEENEPWSDYLVKNNYDWQNLHIGKEHDMYSKLYLESFPYYVIISKSGEIKAIYQSIYQVLDFFEIKSS
jgi:Thioredoxin-like